jgi:hypothetical protein
MTHRAYALDVKSWSVMEVTTKQAQREGAGHLPVLCVSSQVETLIASWLLERPTRCSTTLSGPSWGDPGVRWSSFVVPGQGDRHLSCGSCAGPTDVNPQPVASIADATALPH